jgi:hypothetical protein
MHNSPALRIQAHLLVAPANAKSLTGKSACQPQRIADRNPLIVSPKNSVFGGAYTMRLVRTPFGF